MLPSVRAVGLSRDFNPCALAEFALGDLAMVADGRLALGARVDGEFWAKGQ